eukprot:2038064-Alexandrium_andersonii.AAC.1
MAKEVYDFASAYLDCSNCGSVEDDVIEDYGFRARAVLTVVDADTGLTNPVDDDNVPLVGVEEVNRARRIGKLDYLVRFPLPAVRSL